METFEIKRKLEFIALEEEQARERIAYCVGQVKHLRDDSANAIAFYGKEIGEAQSNLDQLGFTRRHLEQLLEKLEKIAPDGAETKEQPAEEEEP